jgi:hypothetical protein
MEIDERKQSKSYKETNSIGHSRVWRRMWPDPEIRVTADLAQWNFFCPLGSKPAYLHQISDTRQK